MEYVLAVDPGKMTGYAWHHIGGDPLVREGDFSAFLWAADKLLDLRRDRVAVVCEAYQITERTARLGSQGGLGDPHRHFSLEIIGALRFLCEKHGATFAPLQTARDAKSVVSNDLLKRFGWYTVGMDHGRDATRHLVLWLAKTGRLDLGAPEVIRSSHSNGG